MEWGQGYGLTTSQVATTEAYWDFLFTHQGSALRDQDPHGNALADLAAKLARQDTAWLICDSCAELFEFDRGIGRRFNRQGVVPPGNGPANTSKVAIAAAYAWSKIHDTWPSSIQLKNEPPPTDGSVCDFCRRQVYGDEEIALMKEDAVEDFESIGALKRRGGPSKQIASELFWVCCTLCASRAKRLVSAATDREKHETNTDAPLRPPSANRKWWGFWKS